MNIVTSMGNLKNYFAIACLLLPVVGAVEHLCIGADNELQQLFIDGVDVTGKLTKGDRKPPGRHCDCITIPADSGVIAVKAEVTNGNSDFGIQWCESERRVLKDQWRCISRARLLGPAKSKKVQKMRPKDGKKWMMSDYDDSWWKLAKKWSRKRHCSQYYQRPCQAVGFYWTKNPIRTVYCRLKACAANCKACKTVAPGQCDPGQCTFGSGVNEATNATMCQRKCWLEIKAVGTSGPVRGSYIKFTDTNSQSTTQWVPNEPGRYAAILDMESCGLLRQTFQPWSDDSLQTQKVNEWRYAVENTNLLAIDIAVGNGTTSEGLASYAPWIDLWPLGAGANPVVELTNTNANPTTGAITYKTCITGVPYGTPTISDSC